MDEKWEKLDARKDLEGSRVLIWATGHTIAGHFGRLTLDSERFTLTLSSAKVAGLTSETYAWGQAHPQALIWNGPTRPDLLFVDGFHWYRISIPRGEGNHAEIAIIPPEAPDNLSFRFPKLD